MKTALDKKRSSLINRKEVTLHYDNAHPHTAQLTKDFSVVKIASSIIFWPYSWLSLIRGLQTYLDGLLVAIKTKRIASKPKEFYKHCIYKPRWNEVIENDTKD